MNQWIEIYDSEEVQWLLRQKVAGLSATIGAAVSIAVFVASMAGLNALPYPHLLVAIGCMAAGGAVVVGFRLAAMRSLVWCVKLSPQKIMGYNHSRKSVVFAWSDVDHVAISEDAVSVVAKGGIVIDIPTAFDDFTYVSHRILDLAELHRRPIFVGGRAITDLDVFHLLPELQALFAPSQVAAF
jgi:hypothetical protein